MSEADLENPLPKFAAEHPWLCAFVAYFLVCLFVTRVFQRGKLDLTFKPGSAMAKIVEASNLAKFEYVPYAFVWNVHLQGVIFTPYTKFHEFVWPAKYHREVFAFADGEKIALDWFEEP